MGVRVQLAGWAETGRRNRESALGLRKVHQIKRYARLHSGRPTGHEAALAANSLNRAS